MTTCPICGTNKLAYVGLTVVECTTPKCQNYAPPPKKVGGDVAPRAVYQKGDKVRITKIVNGAPKEYEGQVGVVHWIDPYGHMMPYQVQFPDHDRWFFGTKEMEPA